MKEIWFNLRYNPSIKRQIRDGKINSSWRAEAEPDKGNDYALGDMLKGRFHTDGLFDAEEYRLRVLEVPKKTVGELRPEDFSGSDMASIEELRIRFNGHYGRPVTDADIVRKPVFEYLGRW